MPRFNFDAWLARPQSAIAIVGATGWVGRAILHAVLEAAPDISPERLRLFAGRNRSLPIANRTFDIEALDDTARLGPGRWLVAHAGVIGGDAAAGGEVRGRNDSLLENVLKLCTDSDVDRLVLISSGAAAFADDAPPAKAAYARMKRDHEETAKAWSEPSGLSLLVPRIFNLGGPYMTCAQNYALGDFILRLSEKQRLTIGAADPVFRSYVHVLELARTVLDMAVDDAESDDPFDVGGAEVVELGALAQTVARALDAPGAEIARPAPTGADGDWYVGDGRRYQTALFKAGRSPTPLPAIIADTIAWLRTV